MVIFATIGAVFYSCLIGIASGLWIYQRRNNRKLNYGSKVRTFTVIIPFRNEANHLPSLIRCLNAQTFLRDQWECIFVDDHSTDDSLYAFNTSCNFKYRVIQSPGEGKKAALAQAISYASYEHIIQTDADCTFSPSWLETLAGATDEPDHTIITGPVAILQPETLLDHFQSMDMMALMGLTYTGIRTGWWYMGNGANMSYPRILHQRKAADLKDQYFASGDDMFLIEYAIRSKQNHIQFTSEQDAIVYTLPCRDVKSFIHQRLRWAGKNGAMSGIGIKLALMISLGFNMILVALFVMSVFNHDYIGITSILWLQKWIIDFIYLSILAPFFKTRIPLQYLGCAATYPFYAFFISVLSIFKRNYEWKGRVTR